MNAGNMFKRVARVCASLTFFAITMVAFYALQKAHGLQYLQAFGPTFIDGDCYSRMTRARLIEEGSEGFFIRHHDFENFPHGTTPHTTAPMDWLIVLAARLVGGSTPGALDRAGFAVSFWIGVFFLCGARLLLGALHMPYAGATVFLLAVSPVIAHAFSFARPDHQSLTLLFCGWALLLEILLRRVSSKPGAGLKAAGIAVATGAIWGLALWVTWFEPTILLCFAALARMLSGCLRRRYQMLSLAVTGVIASLVMLFEGVPSPGIDPAFQPVFFRWASQIGELQQGNPWLVYPIWVGWLCMATPFFLAYKLLRRRGAFATPENRHEDLFWLMLILLLSALTAWHARWGYFAALALIFSFPWAVRALQPAEPAGTKHLLAFNGLVAALFVASLWPIAAEWERLLYPSGMELRARALIAAETRDLFITSQALSLMQGDGLLCPWWLTPAAVYWSRKNGVAGSSHQSLPGTLDTARFFAATDPEEALEILRKRKVRFVLTADAEKVLENSLAILGPLAPQEDIAREQSMAVLLANKSLHAPPSLQLVFQTQSLKLFVFHDDESF